MTDIRPPMDAQGQVHLWLTHPAEIRDKDLLDKYRDLLGASELSSYHELLNADHRREYLVSQAFLRDVLGYYCDSEPAQLEFERNASGKPAIHHASAAIADLRFNLSHSAELIACAVTRSAEVGVDVEAYSSATSMLEVADHYFSDSELASLRSLAPAQQQARFFKIWTLKEAYIKARGQGLTLALDSFTFDCNQGGEIVFTDDNNADAGWQFWSLQPSPEHMMAVAVAATDCTLRVFSGVPLQETHELNVSSLGLVA